MPVSIPDIKKVQDTLEALHSKHTNASDVLGKSMSLGVGREEGEVRFGRIRSRWLAIGLETAAVFRTRRYYFPRCLILRSPWLVLYTRSLG